MNSNDSTQYRFADLTLDVGQRQVSRDGKSLDVSGLTFDLLQAIVEVAPNIVSADELADKVWAGRPTSPETITQRTMMLRQALGDDAESPKYVEVIRGQGLKLIPKITGTRSKRNALPGGTTKTLLSRIGVAILVLAVVFLGRDYINSGPSGNDVSHQPVRRFTMEMGELIRLGASSGGPRIEIAISPNGSHLVYAARSPEHPENQLYLRALDQVDAQVIAGTKSARHPFFSPDGEWIGFDSDQGTKILKVSVRGGLRKTLAEDIRRMYGASWSEDGTIVYSTNAGTSKSTGKLVKVSADGGSTEPLLVSNDGKSFTWPHFLPGGQFLLFSVREAGPLAGEGDIALLSLDTAEYRTLIAGAYNARYSPTGHIVFIRGSALWAVPFDIESAQIIGEEAPLFDDVEFHSTTGNAAYDFSDDGLLVYLQSVDGYVINTELRIPVWVDRKGNEDPVNIPPANYWGPKISPDGKQAVVVVNDANDHDIWIIDLERESRSRLTFGANFNGLPQWSPDGNRIFYLSYGDVTGTFSKAANGTGPAELINDNEVATEVDAISPDGERMIVLDSTRGNSDMYVLSLSGESFPQPFVAGPSDEDLAEISPDGNYVAYRSDETGQNEVYVRTFPNPDNGRWQISTDGGSEPMWNPDGKELFFRQTRGAVNVVDVQTEPNFSASTPRVIISGDYIATPYAYAISADGERILMFRAYTPPPTEGQVAAPEARLMIVENWFEELKRIAPTEHAQQ